MKAVWQCEAEGSDGRQECGWPVCGCDPNANEVFERLKGTGFVLVDRDHLGILIEVTQGSVFTPGTAANNEDRATVESALKSARAALGLDAV